MSSRANPAIGLVSCQFPAKLKFHRLVKTEEETYQARFFKPLDKKIKKPLKSPASDG
jgi:hypothetical protein